jgi:hypothetical protein
LTRVERRKVLGLTESPGPSLEFEVDLAVPPVLQMDKHVVFFVAQASAGKRSGPTSHL